MKRHQRTICLVGAIVWAGVIFVLSATPGSAFPKRPSFTNVMAHFAAYALLAALVYGALPRPAGGRRVALTVLAAIGLASLYGVTDEIHQHFTPGRVTDPWDWVTDTAGGATGAFAAWLAARRLARPQTPRESTVV
ncbi:MAG: VanZ family protein [Bifidobacteriaceae bacterium]|nr:VanZ family protein [Bifidobacteriaceae bacterium]